VLTHGESLTMSHLSHAPSSANVTSSTKPEVHNILHCGERKTWPRPQATCHVFEICDRTDRHTDTIIATLCTPDGGEVTVVITSGQSNFTEDRIAAANGWFSRIRQVESMYTPSDVLPCARPSLHPKRNLDRFSRFCTYISR